MVVVNIDGFSRAFKRVSSLYNNRVRLGFSGYSQLLCCSFLFSYPSFSYAGPAGGNIVGGTGSINQSGLNTTINQTTGSMAINWDSYNVSANERVQYIQPDISSISLNRILSHSGSEIHGRIDANGQVILVNPNGVFFGPTSQINVGGLIASGLDISPTDFMNGNYIFNEVLGTDGTVINSGLINASLGGLGSGNVTLIGKQVKNEGVINAQLGSVNLAAAKQAVLTFDHDGLIGVRVSKEVLQEELGIDPAVLNSGEINADGGRVLLTASVSQDVFSQAVNSGDIQQATSVVVNEDGTFTLGAGADVANTGSIDVSSTDKTLDSGQIVVLGKNITSSGSIKADAKNADGGDIELHANNMTLLTESSQTTARSENNGTGGVVKVLGDRVGLFDQSTVDVSGANGGGEILIGGDYRGQNKNIRNASGTYIGRNTEIISNALAAGDGGRVIVWGNDSSKVFGNIFAQGGSDSGDGGFIETSAGYVELDPNVNVGSVNGNAGIWLIDPYSITIQSTCGGCTQTLTDAISVPTFDTVFTPDAADSILTTSALEATFIDAANVLVQTAAGGTTEALGGGDITLSSEINLNDAPATGAYSLTLEAHNDIHINQRIRDSNTNTLDRLNLTLVANSNNFDGGDVNINDDISTYGGAIIASGDNITIAPINGELITLGNAATLTANNGGTVIVNGSVATGGGVFTANGANYTSGINSSVTTSNANANLNMTGTVTIAGAVDTGAGTFDANGASFNGTGSTINAGSVDLDGITGGITLGGINASAISATSATSITQSVADSGLIINGNSSFGSTGVITLNDGDNDFTGTVFLNNSGANAVIVTDQNAIQLGTGNVGSSTLTVNATGISQNGTITQAAGAGVASFNANTGAIDLTQANNFTGDVALNNSGNNTVAVTNSGALQFTASSVGSGSLTVNATGITQSAALTQQAGAGATTFNAGAGVITLNQANNFTGTVSLNNSGDNAVTVTDVTDIQLGTSSIGSSTLSVNAVGIDQSGAITQAAGAGIVSFNANAGAINLTQANNFIGDVALSNSGNNNVAVTNLGALQLATSTVGSGVLTVNATGVTQSGALTQQAGAGETTFNAGGGVITLNQANNFTGAVSLNNSGVNAVTVTDVTDIQLGTSSIGSSTLSVNAVGIDQSGAITQAAGAGVASFNANAGAINLTQANNFTGDVALNNSGINNVAVTNSGTLQLATSTIGSGSLMVTATGITQSGTLTQHAVAGAVTFDAGATDIALNQANDFTGAVTVANTNNAAITDANTLIVTTASTANDLVLISGGTGSLILNGATVGRNLNLSSAGSLTIGGAGQSVGVTGDLTAVTLGAIGQSNTSTLMVGGHSQLNARNAFAINQNITLNSTTNDFNTVEIVNAATVALRDSTGSIGIHGNISGALNIISTGTSAGSVIINSGEVNVDGALSFTVADAESINLGNVNNTFLSTLLFNTSGTINDLTVSDDTALSFQNNLTLDGNLVVDATDITFFNTVLTGSMDAGAGNLTATSTTGQIQQAVGTTLTVERTANLDGGTGGIVLDELNDFKGTVSLNSNSIDTVTSPSDVIIKDLNILDIGASIIDGSLTATAGSVTQINDGAGGTNDGITVANTARFTVNDNSSITLDNIDNQFNSVVFSARTFNAFLDSVTISNTGSLDLQGLKLNNDLIVTSLSNITNSGVLDVNGLTQLSANNITLNKAGNDFTDLTIISGNAVSISDNNTLNFVGVSSVNNSLLVDVANGNLTDDVTAVLQVTINTSLNASNGNISLDNGNHDFNSIQLSSSGSSTITDFNSVDIRNSAITGNLTVIADADNTGADNTINNTTGNISVSGSTTLTSSTGGDVLLAGVASNHSLAGPILITGDSVTRLNNVQLNNSGTTNLGTIIANDLIVNAGGNIIDSGVIDVTGLTTLTSGGDIDLATSATDNNISTLSVTAANNVSVASTSVLTFDTVNINGSLKATANRLTTINNLFANTGMDLNAVTGDLNINNSLLVNSGGLVLAAGQNINQATATAINGPAIDITSGNNFNQDGNINNTAGALTMNIGQTLAMATGSDSNSAGTINITAGNANLQAVSATNAIVITTTAGDIAQNQTIESAVAGIDLDAAQAIVMAAASSAQAKGDVDYFSAGNQLITSLVSTSGTITSDSSNGSINDANGAQVNYSAGTVVMRVNSGIGSSDAVETSTAELDVINNGTGGLVNITNTGNVLLTNLVNNGDIDFINNTDVTIDHVDAGFTVGRFKMDVSNGSVFGVDRGGFSYLSVPDITADSAVIRVFNGNFGTFERNIVLKLNSALYIPFSTISSRTFFEGKPPSIVKDESDLQNDVSKLFNITSGQQLIEIESLADIDPAIFTELHNYNQENISIRLPRDQIFDDELENYDRL